MSTVDLGGGMQAPNDLLVFLKARKLDKRIGDLFGYSDAAAAHRTPAMTLMLPLKLLATLEAKV